jgi:tetratricopeptide (TPR) repeat protein
MGRADRFSDHFLGLVVGQCIPSTLSNDGDASRKITFAQENRVPYSTQYHVLQSNMLVARDSRHHRKGHRADILDRLSRILRRLAAIASGRHQSRAKGHKHGRSASHGRSCERREDTGRRTWLVKREISAWRLGLVVCVFLVSLWAGWRIVAETAALNLAGSNPDAALGFVADQHVALNRLAQKELLEPDGNLDSAREWAQRALRSSPLNARALTLLGLIAERKGDQKSADDLMRIAVARTWRDRTTDEWLLNREASRGEYAHALPYADAMLRMDREFQPELFPVLASFTVDPRAFQALTAFLATSPPWRPWFLSFLSTRLANQARLAELYSALNDSGNPPTKDELRPYLNRLIKDENFELAYQTWHATLPPQQRADAAYPFNRDFELPVDNLPFNWNLEPVPGADIQIGPLPEGGRKRTLSVEFSGARVRFANVKQLMVLPGGDYSFSGRVKTTELRTSRGLWWHIFCANGSANTLANTELVSETMPWTEFTVKFQVPVADCRAQWLQLELPARIASESRIEGQVWYQDLQVSPIPSAAAAAPLH